MAPVTGRVKRGEDFQSINIKGLYPAGEGAGYAGGILSAAVDGIEAAEALALDMVKNQLGAPTSSSASNSS
jgi:uncharacterized FAD-dependent dehydrogenase